jgi:hypothetical protein
MADGLTDYDQLLKAHVSSGSKHQIQLNKVNYAQVAKDPRLISIRRYFEKTNPKQLPPKARLAFYINAYNFYTIQLMAKHWKVDSIKDLGSLFKAVWKKEVGIINGKKITLNHLEHDILRKMAEPRIHFAIVCASVSCPDIRNEAYRAEKLAQQLTDQTQLFLNNHKKGAVVKNKILFVSKIFDWFEDDFQQVGGVKNFILKYRSELKGQFHKIKYFDYDWSANG